MRQTPAIHRAIEQITEDAWASIDYTANGEAWVGETTYGDQHRLIVCRTKLHEPRPALFPIYRYHAIITDRDGDDTFTCRHTGPGRCSGASASRGSSNYRPDRFGFEAARGTPGDFQREQVARIIVLVTRHVRSTDKRSGDGKSRPRQRSPLRIRRLLHHAMDRG